MRIFNHKIDIGRLRHVIEKRKRGGENKNAHRSDGATADHDPTDCSFGEFHASINVNAGGRRKSGSELSRRRWLIVVASFLLNAILRAASTGYNFRSDEFARFSGLRLLSSLPRKGLFALG
jgi:hypothetical protein